MSILTVGLIDLSDIFITPVIILGLFLLFSIINKNETSVNKKIFKLALLYRIVLGIIHALLANTIIPLDPYYDVGGKIRKAFYTNPFDFWNILWTNAGQINPTILKYNIQKGDTFFQPNNFLTSKFGGVFEVLTMGSYVSAVILFGVFSLLGMWALYKTFIKMYPDLYKPLAVACLFLPSVSFFGSCYLKDPITLGATGFLTFCMYQIFIERKNKIRNLIFLVVLSYLLFTIKPYILVSIFPAYFFWISYHYKNKIQNTLLRILFTPILVILLLSLFYFSYSYLGKESQRFTTEKLLIEAVTTQDYLKRGSEGKASGYDIGTIEPNINSFLGKIPKSIQFSLFRPFLWEAEKIIQLIASLDSLAIFIFTLYVILKKRLLIFKAILKSPTIQFCLFFSLIFASIMGFVSANYGTLIRYKIPCIPFYIIALILILDYSSDRKKQVYNN